MKKTCIHETRDVGFASSKMWGYLKAMATHLDLAECGCWLAQPSVVLQQVREIEVLVELFLDDFGEGDDS